MYFQPKNLKYVIILVCFSFLFACSDDDATSPGSDDLVGEYVGVILETGYNTTGAMEPSMIGFVGETFSAEVTDNLMLVLFEGSYFDEQVSVQLTEGDDGTYTGTYEEQDGIAVLTSSLTVTYNSDLGEWWVNASLELDNDEDGEADGTGTVTLAFKQCPDWSEYPTEWQVANSYTDGNTGFVELEIESATLGASGTMHGMWFYDDGDSLRACEYIEGDNEVLSLVVVQMSTDYIRIRAFDIEEPETISDPDPTTWDTDTGNADVHLVPVSRLADFVTTDDTLTITDQVDYDTDSQDPGSDYPYFGADLTSAQIVYDLNDDGTIDASMGGDSETRNYGYMEFDGTGYIVSPRIMAHGSDLDVNFMAVELDATGQVTGNGLMQGYDIPDLDADEEIDDDEAEAIDNEGIAVIGIGLDPDIFPFITSTLPTM